MTILWKIRSLFGLFTEETLAKGDLVWWSHRPPKEEDTKGFPQELQEEHIKIFGVGPFKVEFVEESGSGMRFLILKTETGNVLGGVYEYSGPSSWNPAWFTRNYFKRLNPGPHPLYLRVQKASAAASLRWSRHVPRCLDLVKLWTFGMSNIQVVKREPPVLRHRGLFSFTSYP